MSPSHPIIGFVYVFLGLDLRLLTPTEVKRLEKLRFLTHFYGIWCSGVWPRKIHLDSGGGHKPKYARRVRRSVYLTVYVAGMQVHVNHGTVRGCEVGVFHDGSDG